MNIDRYHRQRLLAQIGSAGQEKLSAARVLILGCGALGGHLATAATQCGVGFVRLVDRDIVELTNLQRQVLFDEADVRDGTPKSVAAARRLGAINSEITVEPRVADLTARNIRQLADDVDLILDGTDNVSTRYLLNDYCVKHNRPWIYAACVGMGGRVMPIVPNKGPCLRCIFEQPASASEIETCDTAGVLGTAAATVAALAWTAAMKLIVGDSPASELTTIDVWRNRFATISLADAQRPDCPTCGGGAFPFLDDLEATESAKLCGRNAIQVTVDLSNVGEPLKWLASRLSNAGRVQSTEFFVRCETDAGNQLTAFADGRILVQGTADVGRAKALIARYIGT